MHALVIGYGNDLRCDDGAGPAVAAHIAALHWPGVRALAVHQLAPELAEELAGVHVAVFVDARMCAAAPGIAVERVEPEAGRGTLTHTGDPASLLGLARALYGHAPHAWRTMIDGEDFGLGRGLSARVRARCQAAVETIAALVKGDGCTS